MHPNVQNVLWQTGPVTNSGQGRGSYVMYRILPLALIVALTLPSLAAAEGNPGLRSQPRQLPCGSLPSRPRRSPRGGDRWGAPGAVSD